MTAAGADLMPLDGAFEWQANRAAIGAPGPDAMPALPVGITKVCLAHHINGVAVESYSVAGKSGPNGDYMTPFFTGVGTMCMDWNPPTPWAPGEHVDVHAACIHGTHWVNLTIQYVPLSSKKAADIRAATEVIQASPQYLYQGQWVIVIAGTRVGDTVKVRFADGREATVSVKDLQ